VEEVVSFRKKNCLGVQASKSTYKSNFFGAFFMVNCPWVGIHLYGEGGVNLYWSAADLYETIAQVHLFTACTFLLRTSQPKDSDFRGKKIRVMKRWSCAMVPYIGIWVRG